MIQRRLADLYKSTSARSCLVDGVSILEALEGRMLSLTIHNETTDQGAHSRAYAIYEQDDGNIIATISKWHKVGNNHIWA